MKNIILALKGFIMGIANVIPGVSGGTLALILGIYEQFISSISHLFSNLKENLKFLISLAIGMVLSIATMSNVVDYSFKHFPIPTTLFFVGLVLGGIPLLYGKVKDNTTEKKKISNYIIMFITFAIVIFMGLADKIFESGTDVILTNLSIGGYIILFIVGIVTAATMVIPGVSGSLVLMLLGYYYPVISLIKEITHFNNLFSNLITAGIFGLGIIIGIVLISKLIEFLFAKYETKTYYGVLGFIFASIIAIPIVSFSSIELIVNPLQIVIGMIMLVIGAIIAYKLGEK